MRRIIRIIIAIAPWVVRIIWAALGLAFSTFMTFFETARLQIPKLVDEWMIRARAHVLGDYYRPMKAAMTIGAWVAWVIGLVILSHLVVRLFWWIF